MGATNKLLQRIYTNLRALINTPNDTKLVENIRTDMIELRNLKKQWESLPLANSREDEWGKN